MAVRGMTKQKDSGEEWGRAEKIEHLQQAPTVKGREDEVGQIYFDTHHKPSPTRAIHQRSRQNRSPPKQLQLEKHCHVPAAEKKRNTIVVGREAKVEAAACPPAVVKSFAQQHCDWCAEVDASVRAVGGALCAQCSALVHVVVAFQVCLRHGIIRVRVSLFAMAPELSLIT